MLLGIVAYFEAILRLNWGTMFGIFQSIFLFKGDSDFYFATYSFLHRNLH